jgi:hypothetical protein
MTTFTNESKNSSSATNETKNSSSFTKFLRHGKEPLMSDLENYTFQSVIFMDGTILEDVTFEQLGNIVWANVAKN